MYVKVPPVTGSQQGKVGFESRFGEMLNPFGSFLVFLYATLRSIWGFSPCRLSPPPSCPEKALNLHALQWKRGVLALDQGSLLALLKFDFFVCRKGIITPCRDIQINERRS